jgi:hypothetical protein
MDYYWTWEQSEWANEVLFRKAEFLRRLMPRRVRHGMLNFHSADGMPFLGKKVNQSGLFRKNFHGDLQMDLKRRQEGELGSSSDPQDRTAPERGLAYHQEISGGTGTRACPAAGSSKLDPFKAAIADWLEKDPTGTAAIVEQRLRPLRYNGGHSVLRAYVYTVRPQLKPSRASLRMEPPPGERFAVDSGHVGLLDYASDKRKPYAFALVEAHSRMLYLEFHPQPEFRNLRPLSRACVHAVGRRRARNRL